MEVVQGNQSESRHSRRRSDTISLGENRALDWGSLDSDILLFPHSPLALANVLSQNGGFLDLIPVQADSDKGALPDNAQSATGEITDSHSAALSEQDLSASRLKRSRRDRFNLLTRHDPNELLRQCKKNLVENALVKNKGERQLYLAAGFLTWPDTNLANARKRAPLLLYPALLVRVTDEARYEVRLTGDVPEFNRALMLHAEQRFGIKIPEFDPADPLSDFLAQAAHCIHSSSTVTLEFDVALGSASLLHPEKHQTAVVELPDVPKNFNVALAMSITGNKTLAQLNAVLQLIPNYAESVHSPEQNTAASSQTDTVAGLRKYAARLAAEGLDHVEFGQLNNLPKAISKWTEAVQSALNTRSLKETLKHTELSARELIRLAGIIELIDKAPASVDQLAHADLCYSNSTLLLRRAQHQAKLIEDELEALQEHFVLDKVPAKSQLLSLMTELGGTIDHEPDVIDADYFNARRQFMEFSIHKPGNLTTEHRRLLSQLAKVIRFRELFVNNTEYRSALGPGYKGLRTDWVMLKQLSDYARELAEVLESETIAAKILGNWAAFRSAYSIELDVLQSAADGCRRLLGTIGTRWQTQTVEALLGQANLISSRLVEWRKTYGAVENHAEKTPAIVLSSFSGKSREDVVVETQVDETRIRIDRQLKAGEISREQIIDTLQWLLTASSAASEHDMNIDAIVEHLQLS